MAGGEAWATPVPKGGTPRLYPHDVDAALSKAWCDGGGPIWSDEAWEERS